MISAGLSTVTVAFSNLLPRDLYLSCCLPQHSATRSLSLSVSPCLPPSHIEAISALEIDVISLIRSILSRRGPDNLLIYLILAPGVHLHLLPGSRYCPHLHGFAVPAKIKLAGYTKVLPFFVSLISLSSNGCLNTPKTSLLYSQSSSASSTP